MPTYSYACTECGNRFDEVQSFSDDALTTCPTCSGRLRKLFGNVGVVFKGSGFYRNDSRETAKSSSSASSSSSNGSSGSSESSILVVGQAGLEYVQRLQVGLLEFELKLLEFGAGRRSFKLVIHRRGFSPRQTPRPLPTLAVWGNRSIRRR